MDLKPLDKIICRTPVFGINALLSQVLAELKAKIEESSPVFAELVTDLDAANLDQLPDRIRYALWKYFNRSKFRSTPFGSFAAITLLHIADQLPAKIIVTKDLDRHYFIDWSKKQQYLNQIKQHIEPDQFFLSNSSIYFTGDEIRYLKIRENIHELAAVSAIPELSALLLTCKRKTTGAMIFELMKAAFGMDVQETTFFVRQLIDRQLLFSDRHPNLIGPDYFERLKIKAPPSPSDYIIAERKRIEGNFDSSCLKHFPALVKFMASVIGIPENIDLDHFKTQFLQRFEHQEISLALALDPEIGIGYGNLAQQRHTNMLVDEIKQARFSKALPTIEYGAFHTFLLNKIIKGNPIKLEDFVPDLNIEPPMIPNTFSFIFHLHGHQPVIAYGGGSTATALIGRFTLGNDDMEAYAKKIAEIEAEANPEIAFFDISYQAQGKIDNVNRRRSIYPYELPILTWSNAEMPLDLNDLLVSVENGEVILKSRELGKRVMPRIPSAYNYTRSDLAVYRLLCDVKNQGIATQFSFRLQDFFPKLSYYPRVSFHQLIVSPATWLLPRSLYQDSNCEVAALKKWLAQTGIKFRFRAGYADATLCFDPSLPEDLWALLNFCRQQAEDVYISEALITEEDCIEDEHGTPYFPQYIANFHHREKIYQPLQPRQKGHAKTEHAQLPGGDWLYFELYSHPLKGNSLLLNQVQSFVKVHRPLLKKWFFIRYNQSGPHLRLRLHMKRKVDGFRLIESLKKLIEPELQLGSINDFKIKTYFRETHRYGAKRMDLVEHFFAIDSKSVLYILGRAKSEDQLLLNCQNLILFWLMAWLPRIEDQLSFVKEMAVRFDLEMQIGTDHFKKINANFNALKSRSGKLAFNLPKYLLTAYEKSLGSIFQTCNGISEESRLMADLIHMHVNRLFTSDQRMYETVIYHFLVRTLQIKRAVSKTPQE
ncbi:MAG: thiopeptide-type bacteriocin biosynthesis protein [Pedobacter sp.]|nr:thiopeptide-type bacteriocin biosynthesis protein [Pedobacter sp.]